MHPLRGGGLSVAGPASHFDELPLHLLSIKVIQSLYFRLPVARICFPLLVLKGICHYWQYVVLFPGASANGNLGLPQD